MKLFLYTMMEFKKFFKNKKNFIFKIFKYKFAQKIILSFLML